MMQRPAPLDYARSSSGRYRVWRRLLVVACCLGISWVVWLVIGFATYESFDDEPSSWLAFMLAIPGTMCGLILSVAALVVMREICERRDGGAS